MSALTAPIQVDGCNLKPGPHPFPSPRGRGVLKPFSLREKGGDEGNASRWLSDRKSVV